MCVASEKSHQMISNRDARRETRGERKNNSLQSKGDKSKNNRVLTVTLLMILFLQ